MSNAGGMTEFSPDDVYRYQHRHQKKKEAGARRPG